jgi:XTP/dITP diphosphohydrolase
MPSIVIATGNAGKLREFHMLLAPLAVRGVCFASQRELGIADPAETGASFVENALIKARNASHISGLPAIADDSGLCVDALAGAPGLISAHYAGVHGDSQGNIEKLLAQLRLVPEAQRSAHFVCAMVMLQSATDPWPLIALGTWYGSIALAPDGSSGFGYDPIFIDGASGISAAALADDKKNLRSHRGQAAQALLKAYAAREGFAFNR